LEIGDIASQLFAACARSSGTNGAVDIASAIAYRSLK
jgi:hypothetical protein